MQSVWRYHLYPGAEGMTIISQVFKDSVLLQADVSYSEYELLLKIYFFFSFQCKYNITNLNIFWPNKILYLDISTVSPFYIQSFLPSVILPSVVFYLRSFSTFSYSTFGHSTVGVLRLVTVSYCSLSLWRVPEEVNSCVLNSYMV
jgi:hypothetical protein